VQLYLSLPPSANTMGAKQPPRRLVGFQRIALAPGASSDVTLTIDPAASNHPMSVWNVQAGKWVEPRGDFAAWIGRSSSPQHLTQAGKIRKR
jgi:beta-glucosidase